MKITHILLFLLVFTVIFAIGSVNGQQDFEVITWEETVAEGEHITVQIGGDGFVTQRRGVPYAWLDEELDFRVEFTPYIEDTPEEGGSSDQEFRIERWTAPRSGGDWSEEETETVDLSTERTNELMRTGGTVTRTFQYSGIDDGSMDTPTEFRLYEYDCSVFCGTEISETVEFTIQYIEKDGDRDGDGLDNQDEVSRGTSLFEEDTDNDGLEDGEEVNRHDTNPQRRDTDNDGLEDGEELDRYNTDPTVSDTDDDGLTDGEEVNRYQTDPSNPNSDSDGVDDGTEVNRYNTDPTRTDTDGDGIDDGSEINQYSTSPTESDTDGDELNDGNEVNRHNTDPTEEDTDDDGLDDGEEVNRYGTEPDSSDTDGDGLSDGVEVNRYDTDPTRMDTDGDGIDDGTEIDQGTDPTSPNDPSDEDDSSDEDDPEDTSSNEDTSTSDTEEDTSDADNEDGTSDADGVTITEGSPNGGSSSEEVQRGFFTNNPDSTFAILNSPLNITMLGFLLSIFGILLQLARE
ncbi:MAG: hypothetical protein U5J64_11375 [Halobacteriales archaeon]|nr:hypothetical protein [Halobacteriales archaeon]